MKKDRFAEVVVKKGVDKKLLSPQQKEFNRLTKKIADTKEQIQHLDGLGLRLNQRAALEMKPLVEKHQTHRADTVRLLDRMFRTHKFNKTETRKLRHLITEMSFELTDAGFEDLKEIYNFHSPDLDFDAANAEAEESTLAMMKEMATSMYDIEFEEDADLDTADKLRDYVAEKMAEREAAEEMNATQSKSRKAEKPKTAQQLKAEAKRAAQEEKRKQEEKKISQSVREVYMDLVKAFHPDREPDEAEKIRKTSILQRVTAAYEANDLLALLQLQLELERIDDNHLDALADDKLRYFNKSLISQLTELTDELWAIERQLAQLANISHFGFFNPKQVEWEFEKNLKDIKKEIKRIKQDLELLRDPVVLRDWLRGYRIEREEDWF
ncbi:MAG: hypothetical protein Q7T20_13785 [Saprospiraceae bacterium]|nr:hypothetical protein [Saprospiraceae bacterium]